MIYRILVVEDDPTIQRELVTLLQGDGYQAEAVTDFSAVVSTVRDRQPHLILLDIQLPGQSGFALCSQIRAFSNVPILFVTSSSSDMDELSSLLLGGDGFVTKPYHTAILLAYLFRHAGTICARGDLVSYLWDNQVYVDDNALSVNIGRIREKLAGIGLTGFIQTKHRQGYLI